MPTKLFIKSHILPKYPKTLWNFNLSHYIGLETWHNFFFLLVKYKSLHLIGRWFFGQLICYSVLSHTNVPNITKLPEGFNFIQLDPPCSIIRMGFFVLSLNWIINEDQVKLFTKFYLEYCLSLLLIFRFQVIENRSWEIQTQKRNLC